MARVSSGTGRLVGRDRELETLDSFLEEAVAGGSTLLLSGEPGVGKTALLEAASARATGRGIRVIQGGGVEYETDVSYAGLHQLIDPMGADLRRLPRATRSTIEVALGVGAGPAPVGLSLLNAALTLFREAASSAPLLLVIDDLHWLDRASGGVVGFVGRRLHGSQIGLLGAVRSGAGGFFERAGLSEFPVTPLADADSMALLGSQFAHLPTRVLRGVADEAEGNPLALLEFAAVAAKPQDPAQLTRSSREVHTLFQTRVERLPDAARRLLLLAALDGSGSLGVLARASGGGGLDELGPAERDHLG